MAVMDYSQQQRVIDGTGRILDTTMSNPNVGSWVSEQQLKTWINTGMATDADLAAEVAQREAADTDLKNALDATNARVENLEQEHGSYHDVDVKSVYTIPSGKAKNWSVNVLRGVTRGKNNIVSSLVSSPEVYGITRTAIGDGKLRYSGTCTYSTNFTTASITNFVAGHTYLIYLNSVLPTGTRLDLASSDRGNIFVGVLNNVSSFGVEITANGTNYDFTVQPIVTDLTLYFGGTIPSDADTIAEIQQNYPELLVPSAYGQSLVSTRYEGVKSTSPYNIWNEEWELGRYDNSTGEKISASTSIRSKDFTYAEPNDRLYVICPSIGMRIFFYGINKNFVSTQILYNTSDFTVPSGVYYFTFQTGNDGNPITTYGNNIQFCPYSYTEERDTYHHHLLDTLSLPSPVTLRSAGTVAEEYDLESGEKTNPIGSVDLGTLTWYAFGSSYPAVFYCELTDGVIAPSVIGSDNACCARYVPVESSLTVLEDMCLTLGSRNIYANKGSVMVKDTSIYNASKTAEENALAFKTAMSGVMLYYELATPNAPTQLDPIQNPYLATESGGTVSSILTDAVDDSMTLGYINL